MSTIFRYDLTPEEETNADLLCILAHAEDPQVSLILRARHPKRRGGADTIAAAVRPSDEGTVDLGSPMVIRCAYCDLVLVESVTWDALVRGGGFRPTPEFSLHLRRAHLLEALRAMAQGDLEVYASVTTG